MTAAAGAPITPDDYLAEIAALQGQIDDLIEALATIGQGVIAAKTNPDDYLVGFGTSENDAYAEVFTIAPNRKAACLATFRMQSSLAGDTVRIRIVDEDNSDAEIGVCEVTFETNDGFASGAIYAVLEGATGLASGQHTFRVKVSLPFGSGVGGFLAGSTISITDVGEDS